MQAAAEKRSFFRSPFIPVERFQGLERYDGVIALVVTGLLFAWYFMAFTLIKGSPLAEALPWGGLDQNIYGLMTTAFVHAPGILLVSAVLYLRKQRWCSVGVRREGLRSSVLAGILLLTIYSVFYISRNGLSPGLIYNILYYTLLIGIYEELIFRGFLWPRLVVLFGKVGGTLLHGALFGVMHAPFAVVFYQASLSSEVLNNIGGGIFGSLIFLFIYSWNWNILLPGFAHASLDLLRRV
jgi:uncharacterized protein